MNSRPRHIKAKTSYKPRLNGSLKQACDLLISAAGGLGRASEITHRSTSHLARTTDSAHHKASMTVAVVRALEREAADPVVTRHLAHELGFELVSYRDDTPLLLPTLVQSFSDVTRQSGEVTLEFIAAMENGEIDEGEARRIALELEQSITAHMNSLKMVKKLFSKDGGG